MAGDQERLPHLVTPRTIKASAEFHLNVLPLLEVEGEEWRKVRLHASANKNQEKEAYILEDCDQNEIGKKRKSPGSHAKEGRVRKRGSTRESTPCSLIRDPESVRTPGSTSRPASTTDTNRRPENLTWRHIPTAHEMDEFFAGAEEEQQRQFIEKYSEVLGPALPETLRAAAERNSVGANQLSFETKKELTGTDADKHHSRLLLPFTKIRGEFLSSEEKARLQDGKEMMVVLVEPTGTVGTIALRRWDMKKKNGNASPNYVLAKTWNQLARANTMKAGDLVHVWSFRNAGGELCLAVGKAGV